MKTNRKPRTWSVVIKEFTLDLPAGQSSLPPTTGNLHGKNMADLILSGTPIGDSPPNLQFRLSFVPDGSKLPEAKIRLPTGEEATEVRAFMNYCQLNDAVTLLRTSKTCAVSYAEFELPKKGIRVEVRLTGSTPRNLKKTTSNVQIK